jgi:hypothetical protein
MKGMTDLRGFPAEVQAIQDWLKLNAPVLSGAFEQVLEAEVQHNKPSHILYTLIVSAFDAGCVFRAMPISVPN